VDDLGDALQVPIVAGVDVLVGEGEPGELTRQTLVAEHLEHPVDRFGWCEAVLRLADRLDQPIAQRVHGAIDDGLHQPLAAAEVVEDRWVAHADGAGELLQLDAGDTGAGEGRLGRLEDLAPRLLGGAA